MKYKVGDIIKSSGYRYEIINIFDNFNKFSAYTFKDINVFPSIEIVLTTNIVDCLTELDIAYNRKLKLEKINDTSAMVK